jgi:tetratricopeptide (TPR) repeat protein
MKKPTTLLALTFFLLTLIFAQAQKDQEKADQLLEEAVELMDNGKLDEAIALLEEAKSLGKKSHIYDYEIGLAYVWKDDYATAIKYYEKCIKYPDATDQSWQMLGNSYSMNGDKKKAMKTYQKGLKDFPNSGRLYLEQGVVMFMQELYDEAIGYWEQGIGVEPTYASNYHRLAYIFMLTENEVWGLLYGEILANLEPMSDRSLDIREMMYQTLETEITFNDSGGTVSLCKNVLYVTPETLKNPDELKLPWCALVYEPLIILSTLGSNEINLKTINDIRHTFIDLYWEKGFNTEYPNTLFDYQKAMIDANVFEAYNYWLFAPGAQDEFEQWLEDNEPKWDAFVEWFMENDILLNNETMFLRSNY